MSGHASPPRFLRLLETKHIDVMMAVMNYADRNIYDFEGKVLPECRKQNVGVVAMKVYAGIKGGFPNHKRGFSRGRFALPVIRAGCSVPPLRSAPTTARVRRSGSTHCGFAGGLLLLEADDPRVVCQRGPGLFAAVQISSSGSRTCPKCRQGTTW